MPGLTYLKMLCEQIPELETVKAFDNPKKLLTEILELDFDLLISDIDMPGMNGVSLANLLDNKLVIFTTAHKEYAVDAFDIDAVDYITKPVTKERLQKAITKALERFNKLSVARKFIQCNTDKGKVLLYFDQIQYIRTAANDSRDKEVLQIDGNFIILKNINFDSLLKQLPEPDFCRVNKKEVIAMTAVKFFNHNEITLHHQAENKKSTLVTLSETYRLDFLDKAKI